MSNRMYYGLLQTTENREAYRIWRTRNKEIDDCEKLQEVDAPTFFGHMESSVGDPILLRLMVRELSLFNDRDLLAFLNVHWFGWTLEEVAGLLGITKERARQIVMKVCRVLRHRLQQAGVEP